MPLEVSIFYAFKVHLFSDPHTIEYKYTPEQAGKHVVMITWAGKEIPRWDKPVFSTPCFLRWSSNFFWTSVYWYTCRKWSCDVFSMFVLSKWQFWTLFGAPLDALMCRGACPFSTDTCCVIQEGVITVEKCAHWGPSAHRERHTLSLGQNKHG